MKELVSTAAVSFRHARAQVFSFWPFLSIFLLEYVWWWTSAPPLHKLSLRPRRCSMISDVIRCFFWCSTQYIKLLAVFFIFFYSSWAMCRMMISVPFAFDSFESRSWKHFCSPVFCPEHAFFAPHQSCHKPVPFFTLSTPKCLPLLWSLTASSRTVAEM